MSNLRFRSRHLHATFYNHFRNQLQTLGWTSVPVNFGTQPVLVIDYVPDERSETIRQNTVAVSLGDFAQDEDEELGARGGGLRSALYNVFFDVYMAEQALSLAICDDIRDIYTDFTMPLINQIDQTPVPANVIEVETILGPERGSGGVEQFRRYWRTMRVDGRLYYNT
jgi:hypothetical protein